MTEADRLDAHHEIDHRPARLARPMTPPQILHRRHHKARSVILMERTPTHLEAINQPDPDERHAIPTLVEGTLLRHQARKLTAS
jgi:hypothetical protein